MRDIDSIKNEMNRFLQHRKATGMDRILDSINSAALQSAKAVVGLSGITASQGPMFGVLTAERQLAASLLRPYHDLLDSSVQATLDALRAAAVGPVHSIGLAQMPFDSSIAAAGLAGTNDWLKLMENSTAFSTFRANEDVLSILKQGTGFASARDSLISTAFSAAIDFSNFISLNAGRGIADSFAAQILYNLPVLPVEEIEEMAPEEVVAGIENFFALLLEKLRNLDVTWMNAMGILSLLLAIYSVVFAHLQVYWTGQSDAQSEAQRAVIIEAIQLGNAQVLAAIEKHHPRNSTPVLYVTERITTVRVAPKTRAVSIALIPPGNRVELRDRKGRWIRVEFFDYIDGYSKSGWVMKKYLQMVKD